jgi:hypothetical protein
VVFLTEQWSTGETGFDRRGSLSDCTHSLEDTVRNALTVLAMSVVTLSAALLVPTGPSAAQAGLTITAQSALRNPGGLSVTLAGTYSCGPFTNGVPDRGVIDFTVTQSIGDVPVTGYGYLEPTVCDGAAHRYAVEVTTFGERKFRRGPAQWSASGYVEGDGGLQHGSVPPTAIRIR